MVRVSGDSIYLTRGDTCKITIVITQDGEPYTPSEGDRIRFALNKRYAETEPLILRDIPTDTLLLHLVPEDTKGLEFGKYRYDISLTKENGDVDTFIGPAWFYVTEEVD